MGQHWYSKEELDLVVKNYIQPANVVLDIGCGIRPQSFIRPYLHICCEVFDEYLSWLKDHFRDSRAVLIKGLAQEVLSCLPDRSVDTIFMLDFIEHVDKQDGLKIISECERIARQQIVIFTPLGYMEQEYSDNDVDGWGLNGGQWQVHRSGWSLEDFSEDWEIFGAQAYHFVNGKNEPFDPPFGAFYAVKNLIQDSDFHSEPDLEQTLASHGSHAGGHQDHAALQPGWIEISEKLARTQVQLEKSENALVEREIFLARRESALYQREMEFDHRASLYDQSLITREVEFENRAKSYEQSLLSREAEFENRVKGFEQSLLAREEDFESRVNAFNQTHLDREAEFENRVRTLVEKEAEFESRVYSFEQGFIARDKELNDRQEVLKHKLEVFDNSFMVKFIRAVRKAAGFKDPN